MVQSCASSHQPEENARIKNGSRAASISRSTTGEYTATGFVASQVSKINMATPHANNFGKVNSPTINQSTGAGPLLDITDPTSDRGRPLHRASPPVRQSSNNDRNTLPSQIENGSTPTSLSRYKPITRKRQVSTLANYPRMNEVPGYPASLIPHQVSVSEPDMSSSGVNHKEDSPDSNVSENQTSDDLDDLTTISEACIRGSQRDNAGISEIEQPKSSDDAPKSTIDHSDLENAVTPSGSSLSGQAKIEPSIPPAPDILYSLRLENDSSSSSKEELLIFPSKTVERKISADSVNSTSTVESDFLKAINPQNQASHTLPHSSTNHIRAQPTSSSSSESCDTVNADELHRQLRRVAKFNLETESFFQPPIVPILENIRYKEARALYPLKSFQYGGAADGCQLHDFAYAKGSPGRHVRFASQLDYAPSVHYKSSSEDSCTSTRALFNTNTGQGKDCDDTDWDATKDEQESCVESATLCPVRYHANTIGGGEAATVPGIRRKPVPVPREVEVKARRSSALSPHELHDEDENDVSPGQGILDKYPSFSKTSYIGESRKPASTSGSLLKRDRTEIVRRPLSRNTGSLNRDYTFPLHTPSKRSTSMPLLSPVPPRSSLHKTKKRHRRSSSFGKLLNAFSRKDQTETSEGKFREKRTASFATRIHQTFQRSFFPKSWDSPWAGDVPGKKRKEA